VPLTVDIEAGYSDDLERVAEVVDAVIAAGAVGINIEDGMLARLNCSCARSKPLARSPPIAGR
jgi:2-methylisocitrate lyase-like PEP mutase family enzyme